MKMFRALHFILPVVLLFLVQGSFAQNKSLADAFVSGAPGKAASPGDQASHRKAVDELLTVMRVDQAMRDTAIQLMAQLRNTQPVLQAYHDEVDAYVWKYLSWDALKDDLARIYMETYTEREVRDLLAFYKSPTGQKFLEKTPVLTQRVAELCQQRFTDHYGELQQLMKNRDFEQVYQDINPSSTNRPK